MNLTDLKGELDTRSRPGDNLIGAVRLAAVHHRVRAMRRRRVVAGGATTLIVIVAAITGSGIVIKPDPPDPYVPAVDGFARYAVGSLLVATARASLPGGEVTLTAEAGDLGFTFAQRCEVARPEQVMVFWSVDGRAVGGFSCEPTTVTYHTLIGHAWQSLGVPSGRTVRVRAQLRERRTGDRPVDLARGTLAVALMRRVPAEQYPLPSPPPTLRPLAGPGPGHPPRQVDSDPADPNTPRTTVVEGVADIRLTAQAPGAIEVLLDGEPACTAEWWDYAGGVYGCPFPEGLAGPVTVTLLPRRMAGAWRASIRS